MRVVGAPPDRCGCAPNTPPDQYGLHLVLSSCIVRLIWSFQLHVISRRVGSRCFGWGRGGNRGDQVVVVWPRLPSAYNRAQPVTVAPPSLFVRLEG